MDIHKRNLKKVIDDFIQESSETLKTAKMCLHGIPEKANNWQLQLAFFSKTLYWT